MIRKTDNSVHKRKQVSKQQQKYIFKMISFPFWIKNWGLFKKYNKKQIMYNMICLKLFLGFLDINNKNNVKKNNKQQIATSILKRIFSKT